MKGGPLIGAAAAILLAGVLALGHPTPAGAFIEIADTGDLRLLQDPTEMGCSGSAKITFRVDVDGSADVTPASDGTDAILNAFDRWDKPVSGLPETSLDLCPSQVTQLGTFAGEDGVGNNGVNRIYFAETDPNNDIPSSTVAFANFFFNTSTGVIIDCDIVFNGDDFSFSVDGSGGTQDIEGVAAHEIGHCLGLDHSPVYGILQNLVYIQDNLLKATMFPFTFGIEARSLEPDDVMGAQFHYPAAAGTPPPTLGSISGTVIYGPNPFGIRGGYVTALSTSAPRVPVRGRLSDLGQHDEAGTSPGGAGGYVITGLPPGDYYVFLEPINSFTPNTFTHNNILAEGPFTTNFPPEFYNGAGESASDNPVERTVVTVTAGSNTPNINLLTNSSNDFDGDGVTEYDDNCPGVSNATQTDGDGDGVGDACDLCPGLSDPDQFNGDGDQVGDLCDNCPSVTNPGQENFDGDAQGDACDPDDDNDGVADTGDNCPFATNPGQENFDGDAEGDACDDDDDDDGLLDTVETNTGIYVSPSDTGTNPLNADTDGDGFDDGVEVTAGSDPNKASSTPLTTPALGPFGRALLVLMLLLLLAGGRRTRPS
jgi:hypothetical protein